MYVGVYFLLKDSDVIIEMSVTGINDNIFISTVNLHTTCTCSVFNCYSNIAMSQMQCKNGMRAARTSIHIGALRHPL